LEQTTFQHHGEKILCQVLAVGTEWPWRQNERENRSPINFTKFGKGSLRLLFVASRTRAGQDDAPPRRHEAIIAASLAGDASGFTAPII